LQNTGKDLQKYKFFLKLPLRGTVSHEKGRDGSLAIPAENPA
jgi:hypothetical protein